MAVRHQRLGRRHRQGYGPGVPAFESPLHGDEHWRRVADVGLRLADETAGADHRIVYLFALLHDSQRWTDDDDPEHGLRAAIVAQTFADAGHLEPLTASEVDTLLLALGLHDAGYISDDPTVGVCWDADRLDLPRVGITPDPALLSTDAGRRRIGRPRPVIVLPWASLYLNCAQARFALGRKAEVEPRAEVAA